MMTARHGSFPAHRQTGINWNLPSPVEPDTVPGCPLRVRYGPQVSYVEERRVRDMHSIPLTGNTSDSSLVRPVTGFPF